MQIATGRQWPLPVQRWRSCPDRAARLGSVPVETATKMGSAPAGSHQCGPAVVPLSALLQYFPPARSAAPAGQNSGQPAILDAPWSTASGRWDRFARDVAETHSVAGGLSARPAPPPSGYGSNRA